MAVFNCPSCWHSQVVDDKHIGKNATCPKCKTQGLVESNPSATTVPSTAFVETEARRIVRGIAGPLGIRCNTWMDSERHINKASSLRVESWTVIDETLPVQFTEPCGLLVHNKANDYPLRLAYEAAMILSCVGESVTAFETKHMTFNVWGEHVSTLQFCKVRDFPCGTKWRLEPAWHLYSETDAEEFCGSLNFVSRVRLASNTVRTADKAFILREAQRIAEKVTEADLMPKAPKREL